MPWPPLSASRAPATTPSGSQPTSHPGRLAVCSAAAGWLAALQARCSPHAELAAASAATPTRAWLWGEVEAEKGAVAKAKVEVVVYLDNMDKDMQKLSLMYLHLCNLVHHKSID